MITQFNSTQQNYNLRSNPKQEVAFGRKKIPRYLYHLTTANSWEAIKSSGKLKIGNEYLTDIRGVFMADLSNLFTRWTKKWKNPDCVAANFLKFTLNHVQKNFSNLVILKIKTDNLPEKNKLVIRKVHDVVTRKEFAEPKVDYAINARKYRSKNAIEYIYKDEIPISNVEKIGECKVIYRKDRYKIKKPEIPLLTVWENLLAGNPEAKAIIQLKKGEVKLQAKKA